MSDWSQYSRHAALHCSLRLLLPHTLAVRSTNHECPLDLDLSPRPLMLTLEPCTSDRHPLGGLALDRFSLLRATFSEQGSSLDAPELDGPLRFRYPWKRSPTSFEEA